MGYERHLIWTSQLLCLRDNYGLFEWEHGEFIETMAGKWIATAVVGRNFCHTRSRNLSVAQTRL